MDETYSIIEISEIEKRYEYLSSEKEIRTLSPNEELERYKLNLILIDQIDKE